MRYVYATLVTLTMLLAACSDSTESTTTRAADGGTATTIQSVTLVNECIGDLSVDPVNCADYAEGANSVSIKSEITGDETFVTQFGGIEFNGQMCMPTNQIVVFPAFPDDQIPSGLTRITDFPDENIGIYLDTVQLGLYDYDDALGTFAGLDVFGAIGLLESNYGVTASPHYLLTPDQTWKYGPAGWPTPLANTWSDLPPSKSDQQHETNEGRIVLIDTGGLKQEQLHVNSGEAEPPNLDLQYQGHGQFAASMVNRYNPRFTIDIYSAAHEANGAALLDEISVISAIGRAAPSGNEVMNLSLGGYPCSDADPMLVMTVGLAVMPQEIVRSDDGESFDYVPQDGVRIVAASGNDGEKDRAMFPAQFGMVNVSGVPDFDSGRYQEQFGDLELTLENLGDGIPLVDRITAVGALTRTGSQAEWSNMAEVYVPGEDIVGWYQPKNSLAVWSGTSFAAPRYAACVASGDCSPPNN